MFDLAGLPSVDSETPLQEPFDFSAYAHQTRQLARTLLCSSRTAAEISGSMHLIAIATERDLVRFGEPTCHSRVACAAGCGACCILNVAVLFPEAVTITRYLRRRLPDDALDVLQERLQELMIRTRWLDDEERLFVREPCAFLDRQERCMIHAVRPLLCRSITSTDPLACRDAIAMAPLEGAPRIEMDLFQKQVVDTIYRELAHALGELGFDHRPKRLTSAVLALLKNPELVEDFVARQVISLH